MNYLPASCCKRSPADNGDTAVATIGIIRDERGRSLRREDQGSCLQFP